MDINTAIETGNINAIKSHIINGNTINNNHVALASGYGHLHVLKFFYNLGGFDFSEALKQAAKNGCLECIKFIDNNAEKQFIGHSISEATELAIINNHFDCYKFLVNMYNKKYDDLLSYIYEIVKYGRIDFLKFIIPKKKNKIFLSDNFNYIGAAAKYGKIDCLKYLCYQFNIQQYNKKRDEENILRLAAENGHLECLIFLLQNKIGTIKDAIKFATEKGYSSFTPTLLNLVSDDITEIIDSGSCMISKTPVENDIILKSVECTICLKNITNPSITECGHMFCTNCITTAIKIKRKCPICRQPINSINRMIINN